MITKPNRSLVAGSSLGMLLLTGLFVTGCSPAEIKVAGDADTARAMLSQVLDAWQAGQQPDELSMDAPVVYVSDEDWKAGRKLTDYKLLDKPIENGSHWRIFAELTLAGEHAPRRPMQVCYAVTLGSPTSILRSDFLN